jgi:hypothetical protein
LRIEARNCRAYPTWVSVSSWPSAVRTGAPARRTASANGDTVLDAVIAAAVSVFRSFTGVSPLLGGAVAGYLQRESKESKTRVGALPGAFAFVPFPLFPVLISVAVMMGPFWGRMAGGGMLSFVFVPFMILWNVGLGAIGG